MLLHDDALDPLWKNGPKADRKKRRGLVYRWLAAQLGLPAFHTSHVADIAVLRRAYGLCRKANMATIQAWADAEAAQADSGVVYDGLPPRPLPE